MSHTPHRYFIVNKPYNMVSQFISPDKVGLLGDIDFTFPEGTHAIGRLDNLSEGLLILTTNKKVTALLFQGVVPHKRTYLVRVNYEVSADDIGKLRTGVSIRIKGGQFYTTPPCDVQVVKDPPYLMDYQKETVKQIKHTWLLITLEEGKFHQVRKMVAAIHHRCRRLIRVSIEDLELGDLEPGCVKEIEEKDFFSKLKINNWKK
jgi:23S rRNA pseudouridine2457 synthase